MQQKKSVKSKPKSYVSLPGKGFELYGAFHRFRDGEDFYVFWSDHEPVQEEVVEACDIPFDPDHDEWISVAALTKNGWFETPVIGKSELYPNAVLD